MNILLLLFIILINISSVGQSQQGPEFEFDIPPTFSLTPDTGKSAGEKVNYVSQYGDPVLIKKTVNPISGDKYTIGTPLCISVEIKNNKNDRSSPELKDVKIREVFGFFLMLIDSSIFCDKFSGLNNISDYKLELLRFDTYPIEIEEKANNNFDDKSIDLYNKSELYYNIKQRKIYLFDWNNVAASPSNYNDDDKELLRILKYNYGIAWAEIENNGDPNINISKIIQSGSGQNISLIEIKNKNGDLIRISINVSINENFKDDAILNIYDGRTYKLSVENVNGSLLLYDSVSVIEIDVQKLLPKEYLVYKYYIMPKRYGIFNTETIVRSYDTKYMYSPDIEYPLNIEIKESKPDFEVRSSRNKHEALKDDKIDVIYYITYLGGASEPIYNNVSINLDTSDQSTYHYFDEYGNKMDDSEIKIYFGEYSSFIKGYTSEIPIKISYTTPGIYPLPGIWINGIHHTFDDERTIVKTKLEKNKDLLLGLVLVIIIFIASKWLDIWKHCFAKKFHRRHPNGIKIGLIILVIFIFIFIIYFTIFYLL